MLSREHTDGSSPPSASPDLHGPNPGPSGTLHRTLDPRVGALTGLSAAQIHNVPSGGIVAADVQSALNGLDLYKQTKDSTLTALAAMDNTAGIVVETGADTFIKRTLVSTSGLIGIVSPAGTAGNFDLTLADTVVTPSSYGSASAVATFTVDQQGRLTAAGTATIAIAESQVTNLVTDLAGKIATGSAGTLASLVTTGDVTIGGNIGFYGHATAAKATVTGSRVANPALASLLTALAGYGLIVDSSTI
jgi:hypothetical protein